jgi:hypothetical protein
MVLVALEAAPQPMAASVARAALVEGTVEETHHQLRKAVAL